MKLSEYFGWLVSSIRQTERFYGSNFDNMEPIDLKTDSFTTSDSLISVSKPKVYSPENLPPDTSVLMKPLYTHVSLVSSSDTIFKEYIDCFIKYLKICGISYIPYIDILDLFQLKKTKKDCYAIPAVELWPFMVVTLREIFFPLLNEFGANVKVVNGYRPEEYNKAVGGAKLSRHLFFQALDFEVSLKYRVSAAYFLTNIFKSKGRDIRMGLGIYGSNKTPTRFHIDSCHNFRYWGITGDFLK